MTFAKKKVGLDRVGAQQQQQHVRYLGKKKRKEKKEKRPRPRLYRMETADTPGAPVSWMRRVTFLHTWVKTKFALSASKMSIGRQ